MAEIELGSRSKLVCQLTEFKGKKLVDMRKYYLDVTGKWQPTKKGVAIDRKFLTDLIKCLQNLSREVD